MSFIELPINDLDDVQEDQPVPEGSYALVITDCKEKEKDGKKNLLCIIEIVGHEGAANVLHNVALPGPGDDDEKVKNKLKFIKRFVQAFKIPVKGGTLNPQDFIGKQATLPLKQKEYEGQVSNVIVLPASK